MAYTLLIFYPLMQVRLTRKLPLSRLTLDQNFNELCANLICNLLVYLVTCQINLASDPLQHIASNMTEAKPWAQLVRSRMCSFASRVLLSHVFQAAIIRQAPEA